MRERVFNEDLAYFKNNGWSLWGLGEAIAAQGKDAGARRAKRSRWRGNTPTFRPARF